MFKKLFVLTLVMSLLRFTSHETKTSATTIFRPVRSGPRIEGPKIWNQWGEWSDCSVTCGAGTVARWRQCIAGGCSPGEKQAQLRACTRSACLSDGDRPKIWDQWSKWACCSATCGPGKTIRWRHCVAGGCAKGEKEAQIRKCQVHSCHDDVDDEDD